MKGQTSVEFMAVIGIVFTIFIVFMFFINLEVNDTFKYKLDKQLNNLGDMVVSEFQMAFNSKEGYERTFEMPQTIDGLEYKISISADQGFGVITLKYLKGESNYIYTQTIPAIKLDDNLNNLNKYERIKMGSEIKLKKENNVITVNVE